MLFENEVANTLFIPLTMKALEHRKADGLFLDHQANELVMRLAVPLPDMNETVNIGTQMGTAARVKALDDRLADFIGRHEEALLVTIGCGLDNRLLRLNALTTHGLNIDLPEVINTRERYITEASPLVINKTFSIFTEEWVDFIKQQYKNMPVIFIAEGVLMYFTEQQALRIIDLIKQHFHQGECWFDSSSDAVNQLMNQREDFKQYGVRFQWGLNDARTLQTAHFQLIDSVSIMACFSENMLEEMRRHMAKIPSPMFEMMRDAQEVYKQGSRINGFTLC